MAILRLESWVLLVMMLTACGGGGGVEPGQGGAAGQGGATVKISLMVGGAGSELAEGGAGQSQDLDSGAGTAGALPLECTSGALRRCYCDLSPLGFAYQSCTDGTWEACACEAPPPEVHTVCLTRGWRLCACDGDQNGVEWCTTDGTGFLACECPVGEGGAGGAG